MNTIALDNKTYYEGKFYISPEVKALEIGFQCPNDLSDDYKKLKFCKWAPHALKGQKLLAQGSALGNHGRKFVAL